MCLRAHSRDVCYRCASAQSGRGEQPHWLNGPRGVVWSRLFSERDPAKCDCALLQETLRKASASRLVMGHTIQVRRQKAGAAADALPCLAYPVVRLLVNRYLLLKRCGLGLVQTQGINSVCGDTAIRIDVGMSAGCIDAEPQVRNRLTFDHA